MVWDNAKVQRTDREEAISEGPMRRRGRTERQTARGGGAIDSLCCYKAVPGLHCADRRPLASHTHQQAGKEPRQEWNLAKAFRRKPAVVREVAHMGDAAAGSSVTVASVALEKQGSEQYP